MSQKARLLNLTAISEEDKEEGEGKKFNQI